MAIQKEYIHWIKDNMPSDITIHASECEKCLSGLYMNEKYQISREEDRSNEKRLVYQAVDEQDAKLWLFQQAAYHMGKREELKRRKVEEMKWHYVWDDEKTTPGHVVLKEHHLYRYDAEYDSRKFWMEYVIKMMKPICEEDRYHQVIDGYTSLLNNRYDTPHWVYDEKKEEFVEL